MAKNNFDFDELARWFIYNYTCWWCGLNHADCFHHILGRGNELCSSLLNAAPVSNFVCHLPVHGELKKEVNQIKLLRKTYGWLMDQGYELNDIDKSFIERNQRLYEKVLELGVDKSS